MSQANKQVITHEVSISHEFYAEMARVVGSVGDYLVFEGQDEAIEYFKGNDCLVFNDESEIYDFITDSDGRVEQMKDVLRTHDNCRIIDEGDDCLVFEDLDEARQAVAEESGIEDVFDEETICDWVQENCCVEDVFGKEKICEWVRMNYAVDDVFSNTTLFGNPEGTTKEEVAQLKKENEELKAKIAKMEKTVNQANQIRHLITDLVMPSPHDQERCPRDPVKRPGFDGFVWTWNADAGRGEWC